jgi:hypothetical protein
MDDLPTWRAERTIASYRSSAVSSMTGLNECRLSSGVPIFIARVLFLEVREIPIDLPIDIDLIERGRAFFPAMPKATAPPLRRARVWRRDIGRILPPISAITGRSNPKIFMPISWLP